MGPKLGEILNNADTEGARTLGLMLVYMAGALLPALLLAVLPHALPGAKRVLDRLPVAIPGWRSGRRLRHHPGRRPLRRPNRRALPNSHQRLNAFENPYGLENGVSNTPGPFSCLSELSVERIDVCRTAHGAGSSG